jgi:hypothetical protein
MAPGIAERSELQSASTHRKLLSNAEYPAQVPSVRQGRAVLRAYMNVRLVPPSPVTALFDATRRAGAAIELGLRMRRNGRMSYRQVVHFAQLASIAESDLRLWCLPLLEKAQMVEVIRPDGGEPSEVEERIGVAAEPLEQCSALWDGLRPTPLEACAIESADHAAYVPMTRSDHQGVLEAAGFPAELHDDAFKALGGVGLLRREYSDALGEEILYSPYVWGSEAVDIARLLKHLPTNEREVLATLARATAERPGLPTDQLGANDKLIQSARKVGLFDATRVVTTGGQERAFAFPAGLDRQLRAGSTDIVHERKLFVAHILYGHLYGFPATGKIRDPLVLVRALINKGRVGPTSSIASDYPLLESHGIVRVRESSSRPGLSFLELVKTDVAEDSLDLLRAALGEEVQAPGADPLDALWLPGSFTSPERDRHALPEPSLGDEADVIKSTIEHLREETSQQIRQERV